MDGNISGLGEPLPELMFKQSQPAIVLFSVGYSVVFAGTVLGNIIVVVVIARSRNLWGVTNTFIFNLALSDLLIAFFCIPFTLVNHIFIENLFGDAMCRVKVLAQGLSVGASVFTLASIAADRYFVIVHPHKSRLTMKQALLVIVAVWVASAAIMVPQAVVTYEKEVLFENHTFHICGEHWESQASQQSYTVALFSLCYVAPLVAIGLLYWRIAAKVWFKQPPGAADGSLRSNYSEKSSCSGGVSGRRMRVIRMVVTLVVVFATTWMPVYICFLLQDFGSLSLQQQIDLHHYVYPVVHLVAYANSFINPLIYALFTTNFRQHFNHTFGIASGSRPVSLPMTAARHRRFADDQQNITAQSTPMTSVKVNIVNGNGDRLKGVATTLVKSANAVQETTL